MQGETPNFLVSQYPGFFLPTHNMEIIEPRVVVILGCVSCPVVSSRLALSRHEPAFPSVRGFSEQSACAAGPLSQALLRM